MEAVLRGCPDELWQANLREVARHSIDVRDADGTLVTDAAVQQAIAQSQVQLWSVAWHALEVLEANLTAYFVPWETWAGFGGKGQDHVAPLSRCDHAPPQTPSPMRPRPRCPSSASGDDVQRLLFGVLVR